MIGSVDAGDKDEVGNNDGQDKVNVYGVGIGVKTSQTTEQYHDGCETQQGQGEPSVCDHLQRQGSHGRALHARLIHQYTIARQVVTFTLDEVLALLLVTISHQTTIRRP